MDDEISLARSMPPVRDLENESDADLARAISDGDLNAWDRFFHRFSLWTYRFAYFRLNRNQADAEDLCADILLTAARSIGTYDATRGTLDLWLLGVARHSLSQLCRRRKISIPLLPGTISAQSESFETSLEEIARRDTVNRALANLPERQSAVLVDKYVNGYSTEEIARMQNTTAKAIESLLSRARSALRSYLSGLFDTGERGRRHE